MKRTQEELVTRTYCDVCRNECKGVIVGIAGKDYCEQPTCRTEWDKSLKWNRILNFIKDQPFYNGPS